jgi:tetratricopeptide (TPR) repeat protein
MKSRRRLLVSLVVVVLVGVGVAAALFLTNRREVTTSSAEAYRAYREAIENEQRYYFKDARVGFARALERDPDFAMAILGLARNSDREQAKSLIERARRQRDRLTERERLHVEMQAAFLESKADEAFRIAKTIHEKYPDDTRAAMALAGQEMSKGNTERALQIFSEQIAIDPNNAAIYNLIGYHYGLLGDYDKAVENFKKYQFLAPDQANPYDSLGENQAYAGHYDEAIANLNRALAIKPDFDPAYEHLGVVYEGKGDFAAAIASYEKAADNSAKQEESGRYLGEALRAAALAGDRVAMSRILGKFEKLPPTPHDDVRKAMVHACKQIFLGDPALGERELREVKPKIEAYLTKEMRGLSWKPYDPAWNFLMGRALEAQGKTVEAIAIYEEMANPPNPSENLIARQWAYDGRARLAALLARGGNLERAEKLLAENHKWNPSWAPVRAQEETVAAARREKVLAAAK